MQRKGVGQMLLMELQKYLLEHKPEDWAVSLELISTKDGIEKSNLKEADRRIANVRFTE